MYAIEITIRPVGVASAIVHRVARFENEPLARSEFTQWSLAELSAALHKRGQERPINVSKSLLRIDQSGTVVLEEASDEA